MLNLLQKYFVQINFNKNDLNKWIRFMNDEKMPSTSRRFIVQAVNAGEEIEKGRRRYLD